ncbi:MAG: hypothetical protein M1821_001588 [Bathelium mastoideum]|nr:MAG: hypothetical protein M1821_001588 [Bathelium mastoideum]
MNCFILAGKEISLQLKASARSHWGRAEEGGEHGLDDDQAPGQAYKDCYKAAKEGTAWQEHRREAVKTDEDIRDQGTQLAEQEKRVWGLAKEELEVKRQGS